MNTEKILGLLVISTLIIVIMVALSGMTGAAGESGFVVGYVVSDRINKELPLMQKAQEIISNADKQVNLIKAEAEIEKRKVFQELEAQIAEKLKDAKSDQEKAAISKNYQDLFNAEQQRIDSKNNVKIQEIQANLKKQADEIMNAAKEQIAKVGKQKNVDIILIKDDFIYAKNSIDLTDEVIKLGKAEAEKEKTNKNKTTASDKTKPQDKKK